MVFYFPLRFGIMVDKSGELPLEFNKHSIPSQLSTQNLNYQMVVTKLQEIC